MAFVVDERLVGLKDPQKCLNDRELAPLFQQPLEVGEVLEVDAAWLKGLRSSQSSIVMVQYCPASCCPFVAASFVVKLCPSRLRP